MRSLRLIVATLVFAVSSIAAHADFVDTFAVSITTGGGFLPTDTASGTLALNVTTGRWVSADVSYYYGGNPEDIVATFTTLDGYYPHSEFIYTFFLSDQNSNAPFSLALPVSSLVGYTGGSICSMESPCADGVSFTSAFAFPGSPSTDPYVESGSLTLISSVDPPSAVTPEPSTFALVGTGLLSLAGAARRKFSIRSRLAAER
jgi:PEP-CTERM motif